MIRATRSEVFGTNPQGPRQLVVQVWYPAMASPSLPRAAYIDDADAVTSAFARIHGKPAFLFGHFRYVSTNAVAAAPVAPDQASYPVLLFLEGATGYRQMPSGSHWVAVSWAKSAVWTRAFGPVW